MDNTENEANFDVTPEPVEDTAPASQPAYTEQPQPQPQPQPQAQPPQPQPVKRSKRVLIGGILAGALVILGGGGALAYNMWYQNPDKVVHDAILNAIQAKTMSSTGTIVFEDEDVKMDIALDGKSSQGNGDFNIKANISIDTEEMKTEFEANGSGRMVGETLYLKVTGLSDVVEQVSAETDGTIPPYTKAIIEKIEDRWMSVKASDYEDIYEDFAKQQACLTDLSKKIQSDKAMTDEVMNLYKENKIVSITEQLGSKSVNGVGSLGYKVEFDNDASVAFFKGLETTKLGQELKSCNEDIDFNEVSDDLTSDPEEGEDETEYVPTMELWVSQFGHTITEFSIYGDTSENGKLNIALQPTFNEEFTIEAPADVDSFETVMEEIQTVIMEYYTTELSAGGFAMPEGVDSEINPGLLPSV